MPQPNLGFTSLAKHESAAKFLPSYLNNSPSSSAVCLWQRQREILLVGRILTLLLMSRLYFQRTNSLSQLQYREIRIQMVTWTGICKLPQNLASFCSLLALQELTPHPVKELSFICFKMIWYRLHWVPHSSNILQFGKRQLCVPFLKSWRRWINLDRILEVSACPVGSKLQTCSLSGLSI